MPKISIMSLEDYIRTDFLPSRADDEIAELIDAWIIASNYSRHYVLTYNTQQDLVSNDKFISYLAQEDPVIQEYTEYVTKRISGLNLSDAISTVENVSHKIQNLRDITLPCITNAVEKCLSQLVDKSSTEDIHHAIELNEEHNLVDLSDLDELLYPTHGQLQAHSFEAPDYWKVEYNRNWKEENLKDKALTMDLLDEIAAYVTAHYQNEDTRKDIGFYFAHIKDGNTVERINIDGEDEKQVTYDTLGVLATHLAASQRLAQAQNHSLADDLNAAQAAANRQTQQTTSRQQSHNLKL